MTHSVLEHVAKSARHTSFYLSCGEPQATPIIFVHGWPELSVSWRNQLPVLAGLGFRAIAPDMRGYGRSSVYGRQEDYAQEHIVADMIELLDALGAEKAIWVGHDWGAPVVWGIAQQHPDRCHGVANLCVPYIPEGFAPETIIPLADRAVYPEAEFPAAQWDYQLFYRESFDVAHTIFGGQCAGRGQGAVPAPAPAARPGKGPCRRSPRAPAPSAAGLAPGQPAPDLPRDETVLSEEEENRYTAALEANGFFGADSWYMNGDANRAFAQPRPKANWRLAMPVLFLHAAYEAYLQETIDSRLPEPMRDLLRQPH